MQWLLSVWNINVTINQSCDIICHLYSSSLLPISSASQRSSRPPPCTPWSPLCSPASWPPAPPRLSSWPPPSLSLLCWLYWQCAAHCPCMNASSGCRVSFPVPASILFLTCLIASCEGEAQHLHLSSVCLSVGPKPGFPCSTGSCDSLHHYMLLHHRSLTLSKITSLCTYSEFWVRSPGSQGWQQQ